MAHELFTNNTFMIHSRLIHGYSRLKITHFPLSFEKKCVTLSTEL